MQNALLNLSSSLRLRDDNNGSGTDVTEGDAERKRGCQKKSKVERQTVTVKDKTKTTGSVSERRRDKSQADSCWRLHHDIGETSCHWQRYARVLLMSPCIRSPFVVNEMKKRENVLPQDTRQVRSMHALRCKMLFLPLMTVVWECISGRQEFTFSLVTKTNFFASKRNLSKLSSTKTQHQVWSDLVYLLFDFLN